MNGARQEIGDVFAQGFGRDSLRFSLEVENSGGCQWNSECDGEKKEFRKSCVVQVAGLKGMLKADGGGRGGSMSK